MIDSNAVTEAHAMRTALLVGLALLFAPSLSLAGHHGHIKKLCEHHQQHKFKHQLKKAMKEGCNNCGDGEGGGHGHGHILHHHKKK
jgi:hypothetical protein